MSLAKPDNYEYPNNVKRNSIYIILLILLVAALSGASSNTEKTDLISNSYFPVDHEATLIYESSFGESITKYFQEDECIISLSESDDFVYRQALVLKDDGVYTKETYQYFKIFLFIKTESTVTYKTPLLRFPLPLSPGLEWDWEGDQYSDGEIYKVKITGKAFNKEFVTTKAGSFEAIKLETVVETADDVKNKVTEWYAEGIGLIKAKVVIEGGGVMGLLRDVLGYGTIEFELVEIRE